MDDVENEKFSWKTQLWLWCQLREVVLIPDSYSLTYFHIGNSPYFHFPVILQLWNSGGLSLLFFFFSPIHSSTSCFHLAQEFLLFQWIP